MKRLVTCFMGFILVVGLAGCADMTNQDVGVLTGGAIGGALGSQFGGGSGKILATVGGTVLGAYLGGSIGNSMDKTDRMRMQQSLEHSKIDQVTTWDNPDNGNRYYVKPTRTYYRRTSRGSTQPCREYTTKAHIAGKTQTIYGKACRMRDGSWKVVR